MPIFDPRRLMRTPGIFPEEDTPLRPISRPSLAPSLPLAEAPPLPALSRPQLPAMASPGNMATPPLSRPTDYRGRDISNSLDFERNQYVRKGATEQPDGSLKFKRSAKDTLLGAGLGALRGLGTGGGLGAALGGALGGAVVPLISPRMGREGLFEQTQAPLLRQDMAEQAQAQALQRQAAQDALKARETEANIERTRADTQRILRPEVPKPLPRTPNAWQRVMVNGKPVLVDLNAAENQGKSFEPYIQPRVDKPDYDTDPDSGMSGIEMGQASYDERGGDQYVIERLPKQIQEIYSTGQMTESDGTTRPADMNEIMQAQRVVAGAIERQKRTDERYSKAHIRSKVMGGRKGTATPSSPTPLSRPSAKSSAPAKPATPSKYQGATISIDAVRQYASEKGIDEQEALSRFKAKGLNVR